MANTTSRDIANALCVVMNAAQDLNHEIQICHEPENDDYFVLVNDAAGARALEIRYQLDAWEVV